MSNYNKRSKTNIIFGLFLIKSAFYSLYLKLNYYNFFIVLLIAYTLFNIKVKGGLFAI